MSGSKDQRLRVAVLMGGLSSERDISLSTGKQILEALDSARYESFGVDAAVLPGGARPQMGGAECEVEAVNSAKREIIGRGALVSTAHMISHARPNVVFIALHGRFGEDGTIQGMLDLLGLPYTGSGVLASALAMDKSMAKRVLSADGLLVPPSVDFTVSDFASGPDAIAARVAETGFPVMVKPSRQGSTIGMTRVSEPSELEPAIAVAARFDTQILVEKFVAGTELTVSVLGNDDPRALPVIEIVPHKGFYDYEAKYTPGATDEIVPARISDSDTQRAQAMAIAAHRSLGCRGMSRADFILTSEDMFLLEVNTIPGMTPTSLLPRAAAAAGIPFGELLDMIIQYALEE